MELVRRVKVVCDTMIMDYYVYVIKSKKMKWSYVGMSKDIKKRLKMHNTNKVTSTKNKGPFRLVYKEGCTSSSDAREREMYFKSNAGKEYLQRRGYL